MHLPFAFLEVSPSIAYFFASLVQLEPGKGSNDTLLDEDSPQCVIRTW